MKENRLVDKIKKGDTAAFKKIYDQYHKQLFFVAKGYLKDKSCAEDAVQDVFLKLWHKRDKLDSNFSSIKGWLYTTMKNHLVDLIRKKKTRKKMRETVQTDRERKHERNKTEHHVIYEEYEEIVGRAFSKLSPAQKKVFKLRGYDGLSNTEVAKMNNVSVHTVKTQYYLGSKFIRNYLKKHADI